MVVDNNCHRWLGCRGRRAEEEPQRRLVNKFPPPPLSLSRWPLHEPALLIHPRNVFFSPPFSSLRVRIFSQCVEDEMKMQQISFALAALQGPPHPRCRRRCRCAISDRSLTPTLVKASKKPQFLQNMNEMEEWKVCMSV